MIICGVVDNIPWGRMLHEPDINLRKAKEVGKATEETKMNAKQHTETMEPAEHFLTQL